MSEAITEFPFGESVVSTELRQVGLANLLLARPTGYGATMVGFPYDDLASWRGPYPADIFAAQFEEHGKRSFEFAPFVYE